MCMLAGSAEVVASTLWRFIGLMVSSLSGVSFAIYTIIYQRRLASNTLEVHDTSNL